MFELKPIIFCSHRSYHFSRFVSCSKCLRQNDRRFLNKCKCVCLWSDIPFSCADFANYIPGIGTLSYIPISSGENSAFAHFAAATANHYVQLSRSTRYPSLLGEQRQRDMKALHDTSTHGRHSDSSTGQPSKN